MADLLALQPNMDINLHIVAPYSRREKVFQELRRPCFRCWIRVHSPRVVLIFHMTACISYDGLRELGALPHIAHTSDSILEEYAESVD